MVKIYDEVSVKWKVDYPAVAMTDVNHSPNHLKQ